MLLCMTAPLARLSTRHAAVDPQPATLVSPVASNALSEPRHRPIRSIGGLVFAQLAVDGGRAINFPCDSRGE
jgi:hypothetical protein